MTVNIQDMVKRVSIQLYDEGNANWSEPELAEWADEAIGALAALRPDLFTRTTTIELQEGAKQSLPSGSIRVTRVTGVRDGSMTAPPRAVTRCDMRSLAASAPDWQNTRGIPRQYTTTADQTNFWVYPCPGPTDDYFADVESVKVPSFTAVEHWDPSIPVNVELDPRFERALVDYVLYRALDKDADYGQNATRAKERYQAFHDAAFDRFYLPSREAMEQAASMQSQSANNNR